MKNCRVTAFAFHFDPKFCAMYFNNPFCQQWTYNSSTVIVKGALLDNDMNTIIIRRALRRRWCWNWQTGMVEGHVSQDVEVQVLSSAPMM